jgi:hypothetical protein
VAERGHGVRRLHHVRDGDRDLRAGHERHGLQRRQRLHGGRQLPERDVRAGRHDDVHRGGVQGRGNLQSIHGDVPDADERHERNGLR